MLRGTLILFALVILAVRAQECTCKDEGNTIEDGANARWRVATVIGFNFQPLDLNLVTGWGNAAGDLSDATKLTATLSGDAVTTASVDAIIQSDNQLLADVNQKIEDLNSWESSLDAEIQNFQSKAVGWATDLNLRIQYNDDPQIAAKVIKESFEIASQTRRIERVKGYIGAALEYYNNIVTILGQKISIYTDLKTLLTSVDEQVNTCTCPRSVATATVLLTTPPTAILAKITAFQAATATFVTNIKAFIDEHANFFVDRTEEDTGDDSQLVVLYNNWAVNQKGCFTFEEFKGYVSVLASSEVNKAALVARVGAFLKPTFTVSGGAITFTGLEDTSDVVVCKYTGTITGSIDVTVGVTSLAKFLKQVALAFFGATYCTVDSTVDSAGAFVITLEFKRSDAEVIANSLLNNEDIKAAQVDITTYEASAQTKLENYIQEAKDDSAYVNTAITSFGDQATAAIEAAATDDENAKTLFAGRVDARVTYDTNVEAREQELQTADDKYAVIITGFSAYKTEASADIKAFVAEYEKRSEQCACEVYQKVKVYLKAKYDALTETVGTTAKDIWTETHAALEADIKQSCILQDQTVAVHAEAQAQIEDWETNGEAQASELNELANKLRNDDEEAIAEVQTRLHADPAKWKERLSSLICGCSKTIDPASVVIDLQNTDKAAGDFIVATFTFVDTNTAETAAEIEARHILTVSTAIEVGGCNKGWKVAAAASASGKRQAGSNTYQATLGEAPVPGQPASANTLVYSFVLAIVTSFMLVWF